jgi:hypothetical protein
MKPTRQVVITNPEQAALMNPGNNMLVVNKLTTTYHLSPRVAENMPPVQQANRSLGVRVKGFVENIVKK